MTIVTSFSYRWAFLGLRAQRALDALEEGDGPRKPQKGPTS
jgi:hypothetical protein